MNNTAYYITKPDGSQEGPYTRQALISRIQAGKYPPGTQLWHRELPGWEPLEKHFSIPHAPSAADKATQLHRATRPLRKAVVKSKQFPAQTHSAPGKFKRSTVIIIAALLVLAVGGTACWYFGGDTDSPPAVSNTQKAHQRPATPPEQPQPAPEPEPEPEPEPDLTADIEPTEEIEEISEPVNKTTAPEKESMGRSLIGFAKAIGQSIQATNSTADKTPGETETSPQKTSARPRPASHAATSTSALHEEDESEQAAPSTLTPEQTRELRSCERKIRLAYRRKQKAYKRIAFYKQKIYLHEECRDCHNCSSQGITGACRHWAMEEFDGKRIRVCHQLPHGSQRYSGIDQAISSLELKIESLEKVINGADEMISEQQQKMSDIAGDAVTPPEEPEYEYENFIPTRGTSGSGRPNSRSGRGRSSRGSYSY